MALQTSSAMFPNSPLSQQYMGLSPDKTLYKYTLKCRLRSLFYLWYWFQMEICKVAICVFKFLPFIFICCVCRHTHATVSVWRSEDNFRESVLSSHPCRSWTSDSGDQSWQQAPSPAKPSSLCSLLCVLKAVMMILFTSIIREAWDHGSQIFLCLRITESPWSWWQSEGRSYATNQIRHCGCEWQPCILTSQVIFIFSAQFNNNCSRRHLCQVKCPRTKGVMPIPLLPLTLH